MQKIINRSIILFFFLFLGIFAQAQNSFKISGKLVDENKQPVPLATVALLKSADSSVVTGALSDDKGGFVFTLSTSSKYKIKVSTVGYEEVFSKEFIVNETVPFVKVPDLTIKQKTTQLKDINITSTRSSVELAIDKKVYNVDKNIMATGGNATDILRNIPAVNVDIDGNVSLRGSNQITVLIDGKISGLTGSNRQAVLEQIPAGTIESVEVITNPSAKYDAEGMGGIINIILKKNRTNGSGGNISAGVGSRNKYNTTISLNARKDKFAVNASYNYRFNPLYGFGASTRDAYLTDTSFFLRQNNDNFQDNITHVTRFGVDYFLNKKTSFYASWVFNYKKSIQTEDVDFYNQNYSRTFNNDYRRSNVNSNIGTTNDINVGFKQLLSKKSELTGSILWSESMTDNGTDYSQIGLSSSNVVHPTVFKQTQFNDQSFRNIVGQLDFMKPFGSKNKLESGLKATQRLVNGNNIFDQLNNFSGLYESVDSLKNTFEFNEKVFAGYSTVSLKKGKFGFMAGLRAEFTDYYVYQQTTNEKFLNDYFRLFPSAFLTYKPTDLLEIQASYSRRLNRPGIGSLNPIVDYTDPLNIRIGNPYLMPEFTNNFEISAIKYLKKHVITATLYNRETIGVFNRFRTILPSGVSIIQFQNLNSAVNTGFELVGKHDLTNWWSVTSNFNYFYTFVDGKNLEGDLTNYGKSWNAKLISNMRVIKKFDVQVSSNYASPLFMSQGRFFPFYGTDLGLKYDFKSKKGSVTFNVADVFDTRMFRVKQSTKTFDAAFTRKRETQIATLTFIWKFGKETPQSSKKMIESGSQGGGEMF